VAALMFSAATTALSFQDETLPPVQIALDVNTQGNSGNALGTLDSCLSVNQGDTFDVDVTVRGIPPISSNFEFGLAGYGLNLHFDPNVVHTVGANSKMMIQTSSGFEFIGGNYVLGGGANPFPGTSGDSRVDFVDLGSQASAGDGVLARITLQAIGPGTTDLKLDSELESMPYPATFGRVGSDLLIYPASTLQNGRVTVGQPCENPPTPFNPTTPQPTERVQTPTPGSTASRAPAGDTQLAIDTVITGNNATKVDQIDACASAKLGDKFEVDVVIKGVQNLLAYDLPVSYDPQVLRVVDRNVKLFLQGNSGSQVIDASGQTPDDTGVYAVAAVDSADPVAPDSGDGILVRLTFEALKEANTKLSIKPADIDGDRVPDRGILLRNIDNAIIGDTNGDTFFDGPVSDAEIRVGAECATPGHVVVAGSSSETNGSGGGDNAWVWIAIGAGVVAVVAAVGAGLLLARRRGRKAAP
jgi:hypothetical protein